MDDHLLQQKKQLCKTLVIKCYGKETSCWLFLTGYSFGSSLFFVAQDRAGHSMMRAVPEWFIFEKVNRMWWCCKKACSCSGWHLATP